MMKEIDVCKKCGRSRSEHCEFEPVVKPDSCVCDVSDWGYPIKINDICDEFVDHDESEYYGCERCGHLRECHVKKDEKVATLKVND